MNEKPKKRGPATRRRLARQRLDSGLTAREFATAHGLSSTSLHRWNQELRRSEPARVEPAGFIELATVAAPRVGLIHDPVRARESGGTGMIDR
jgi:transposase-like protein